MCIESSVGRLGINATEDAKIVLVLLNLNIGKLLPLRFLAVKGRVDAAVIEAIERIQAAANQPVNGLLATEDATLQFLRANLPKGLLARQTPGDYGRRPIQHNR
jgi:hypothetical protein